MLGSLEIQDIQQTLIVIHKAIALLSRFSMTLTNPVSIRLVLLGLAVMPVAVVVLVFDLDGHCSDSQTSLSPSR